MILIIKARGIAPGEGSGVLLCSPAPISFLSGVDPETGEVVEHGHPLRGRKIGGTVLAFPHGKGSTVGSYVLYALRMNRCAPAAMINIEAEPIVAVGAIIAGIPMVDRPEIPIHRMRDGAVVHVDGSSGVIRYEGELEED